MGMEVGENHGSMSVPNVVPLIDILLVLIIIFMVITPRTPNGLDALVPQPPKDKQKQQEPNDRTIVVQVVQSAPGQRPTLKINQDPVAWDQLQTRLSDIFKTRAERVMFVKGDDEVPFSDVAQVIDIAHASNVEKVGLITAKIEAGQ